MPHHLIASAAAWPHGLQAPAWLKSGSGYLAAALVLATFCMSSMRWLRATAIGSNIAFIGYAAVADIRPVLILHIILLPVNVFRLVQIQIAVVTARRLMVTPDVAETAAAAAEPHFLSPSVVADPGAALPLAEREQERVMRLLVACVPGEAAAASGLDPQTAAAAPHLLDAIDAFLTALVPGAPTPGQLRHMADLHSRNELLRGLHEALTELSELVRQAASGQPAAIATMVSEGLGTLLLHAEAAAHSRAADDIELLARTTEDRSALVERIRQSSITGSTMGNAADFRTIYSLTALYERAVWLLHRYGALLTASTEQSWVPVPPEEGGER